MAKTTRTLNPLHFEDLEPHRFEDLIRQLTYDFRPWKRLEPTGRLGADDSIDTRGVESVVAEDIALAEGDEEEERPSMIERLWTIQCKREKSVHPADIKKIIKDAIPEGGQAPYGFILAAACDFSKKSRDTFIIELREWGVEEFYLWGKADLEDMLFQPKNDHLLFAYFGISLQIRRRTMKSEFRSRLATKKTLERVFRSEDRIKKAEIALIDVTLKLNSLSEVGEHCRHNRITFCRFDCFVPGAVGFLLGEYDAYIDDDNSGWDAMLSCNMLHIRRKLVPSLPFDFVREHLSSDPQAEREKIERKNSGSYKLFKGLNYERIVGLDEHGDAWIQGTQIFVEPLPSGQLFKPEGHGLLFRGFSDRNPVRPDPQRRIVFFPADLRGNPNKESLHPAR